MCTRNKHVQTPQGRGGAALSAAIHKVCRALSAPLYLVLPVAANQCQRCSESLWQPLSSRWDRFYRRRGGSRSKQDTQCVTSSKAERTAPLLHLTAVMVLPFLLRLLLVLAAAADSHCCCQCCCCCCCCPSGLSCCCQSQQSCCLVSVLLLLVAALLKLASHAAHLHPAHKPEARKATSTWPILHCDTLCQA